MKLLDQLKRPFPVNRVRWREGGFGKELAYIDARDVMQRLDEVFGEMWQCKYTHVGDHGVICDIGIFIDGQWIWRADGSGATKIEAEKGAMSKAFVRSASRWGIGRYLYAGYTKDNVPKWATPEGYDDILKLREEKENDQ